MKSFEVGLPIDLAALSEEELVSLLGEPLARMWLETRDGREIPFPPLKVLSVDRAAGTVVIGIDDEGAEDSMR